ncbi:hypothetical protein HJ581_0048185 [Rhodococcus opacus]|nr:hypothetical protein HJ581_0048185 [Rhodococcus opacus]
MDHRDARVSAGRGTAFGVVQAVNTCAHHKQPIKGAPRAEPTASTSSIWLSVGTSEKVFTS